MGGLSQFDYKLNDKIDIAGGVDYRWYKGEHYTEIRDLLGGDYFVNTADENEGTVVMQDIIYDPIEIRRQRIVNQL